MPGTADIPPRKELAELLISCFSTGDELRAFVLSLPDGAHHEERMPGPQTPRAVLAQEVVEILCSWSPDERAPRALFVGLLEERPEREAEIGVIAARWGWTDLPQRPEAPPLTRLERLASVIERHGPLLAGALVMGALLLVAGLGLLGYLAQADRLLLVGIETPPDLYGTSRYLLTGIEVVLESIPRLLTAFSPRFPYPILPLDAWGLLGLRVLLGSSRLSERRRLGVAVAFLIALVTSTLICTWLVSWVWPPQMGAGPAGPLGLMHATVASWLLNGSREHREPLAGLVALTWVLAVSALPVAWRRTAPGGRLRLGALSILGFLTLWGLGRGLPQAHAFCRWGLTYPVLAPPLPEQRACACAWQERFGARSLSMGRCRVFDVTDLEPKTSAPERLLRLDPTCSSGAETVWARVEDPSGCFSGSLGVGTLGDSLPTEGVDPRPLDCGAFKGGSP